MSFLKVHMRQFALARAWLWVLLVALSVTDAQAETGVAERCKALGASDFSMLQDAPTQIIGAKQVDPNDAASAYCEVNGYVAPSFGFLIRLPSEGWNGKLMQMGCGGACGTTSFISMCPLNKGYACITSDGGHQSTLTDMKWTYNNPQGLIDLFVQAPHLTTLVGRAIVERYYRQPPSKSYFMGFSTGPIQALFAAQRFPWDFDGILSYGTAQHITGVLINLLWGNRAFNDSAGNALFEQAHLDALYRAVVAKCDLTDGIKDGLIGDPRDCDFNPAELLCAGGKGNTCLTAVQVEAVTKIYNGPVTSKGEQIVLPAALRGSEQSWLNLYGGSVRSPSMYYSFSRDWFRYSFFQPNPAPAWKPEDFDFDRDYKRLGMAESLDAVNHPDLSRFKARGGKLLMSTGWSATVEEVLGTVEYYEKVEKVMGGRAQTQDFFRLFMIPGVNHGGGGNGPSAVDYLSYLEDWVERGKAPDKLIASHIKKEYPGAAYFPMKFPLNPEWVEFSRPIYPYPVNTKYLGRGDPKDASSFGPKKP